MRTKTLYINILILLLISVLNSCKKPNKEVVNTEIENVDKYNDIYEDEEFELSILDDNYENEENESQYNESINYSEYSTRQQIAFYSEDEFKQWLNGKIFCSERTKFYYEYNYRKDTLYWSSYDRVQSKKMGKLLVQHIYNGSVLFSIGRNYFTLYNLDGRDEIKLTKYSDEKRSMGNSDPVYTLVSRHSINDRLLTEKTTRTNSIHSPNAEAFLEQLNKQVYIGINRKETNGIPFKYIKETNTIYIGGINMGYLENLSISGDKINFESYSYKGNSGKYTGRYNLYKTPDRTFISSTPNGEFELSAENSGNKKIHNEFFSNSYPPGYVEDWILDELKISSIPLDMGEISNYFDGKTFATKDGRWFKYTKAFGVLFCYDGFHIKYEPSFFGKQYNNEKNKIIVNLTGANLVSLKLETPGYLTDDKGNIFYMVNEYQDVNNKNFITKNQSDLSTNNNLVKKEEMSEKEYIAKAKKLCGDFKDSDAIKILKKVITQNPNNADAYYWLGVAHLGLRKSSIDAIEAFQKAEQLGHKEAFRGIKEVKQLVENGCWN